MSPIEFDAVADCAQDHGVPPHGVSHLDFRHQLYRERLDVEAASRIRCCSPPARSRR